MSAIDWSLRADLICNRHICNRHICNRQARIRQVCIRNVTYNPST